MAIICLFVYYYYYFFVSKLMRYSIIMFINLIYFYYRDYSIVIEIFNTNYHGNFYLSKYSIKII